MKVKEKKTKTEVPFDPVLFAASMPSRKPTAKDIEDCKEREDDAVEPQESQSGNRETRQPRERPMSLPKYCHLSPIDSFPTKV